MLLFDFFAGEEYGYKRFPIIFIQDANGEQDHANDEGCRNYCKHDIESRIW